MLQVKERRHPWRRLTTSHSRKTGRPHRLSPPVFFLTPPPARKRTEGPISLRLRKPWGTRRGDILVPLFSTVAFAGPRWGRSWADRRGDFQSPRGSGGRKTPTPFHAGFCRTGAGGGAPKKSPKTSSRRFEHSQRSKEGAKNDAPPNEHRRPSGRRLGTASGAASSSAPTGNGVLPGADLPNRQERKNHRTTTKSPHPSQRGHPACGRITA